MRNMLALVGLALLTFVGVGYYRGWYQLATEPTMPGHREFHVDVNTNNISKDVTTGENKVKQIIAKETGGTSPANTTPTVPGQPTSYQPNYGPTITGPSIQVNSNGVTATLPALVLPGTQQQQ